MTEDDSIDIEAGQQQLDGFLVDLDLHLTSREFLTPTFERVTGLLMHLGTIHEQIRRRIIGDFQTIPLLKDYLVPELFTLEEPYKAHFFPNIFDENDVTPEDLLKALTMCRVGYYDHYETSGLDSGEALIIDYRLLVPDLIPGDMERQHLFLRFKDQYDITNQVVVARVSMDGVLIDLSVES